MTKIKIEGASAAVIAALITQSLRDQGLKVDSWHDVTPGEVASCNRSAGKKDKDICIVAMTR